MTAPNPVRRVRLSFNQGRRLLQREGFAPFLKRVGSYMAHSFFSYGTYYIYENTLERVEHETSVVPEVRDLILEIVSSQGELSSLMCQGYDFSPYPNIEEDRERLHRGLFSSVLSLARNLPTGVGPL